MCSQPSAARSPRRRRCRATVRRDGRLVPVMRRAAPWRKEGIRLGISLAHFLRIELRDQDWPIIRGRELD
jgi:hypothetical protein